MGNVIKFPETSQSRARLAADSYKKNHGGLAPTVWREYVAAEAERIKSITEPLLSNLEDRMVVSVPEDFVTRANKERIFTIRGWYHLQSLGGAPIGFSTQELLDIDLAAKWYLYRSEDPDINDVIEISRKKRIPEMLSQLISGTIKPQPYRL